MSLLLSAVGGTIGAAVTYWFWLRQHTKEILRSYDQELRTARFKAYQILWQEFEPLAVYLADRDITYARVLALGVALRRWYFHEGGLLLTERARNTYFLVQDAIAKSDQAGLGDTVIRAKTTQWTNPLVERRRDELGLVRIRPDGTKPSDQVRWEEQVSDSIGSWQFGKSPDDDFVLLQYLASSLRTILARDLHARSPSILDRSNPATQHRGSSPHASAPSANAPPSR